MFVLNQGITSYTISLTFLSPSLTMHQFDMIFLTIFVSLATYHIYSFSNQPDYYGDFRTGFKSHPLAQHHYYLFILSRTLLFSVIVYGNNSSAVGYVASIVPALATIYLIWQKPYLHAYNNWRAVANETVIFVILLMYAYFRSAVQHNQHLSAINRILPSVELSLLYVVVISSLVLMVKYKIDQKK